MVTGQKKRHSFHDLVQLEGMFNAIIQEEFGMQSFWNTSNYRFDFNLQIAREPDGRQSTFNELAAAVAGGTSSEAAWRRHGPSSCVCSVDAPA